MNALAEPRSKIPGVAWRLSFVLGGLLIACGALRWPFLSNPLVGEEGIFASMVVPNGRSEISNARKPFLIARIAGTDYLEAPQHPVPPHWFLLHVLRPLMRQHPFDQLRIEEKSALARWPFFCLFVVSAACWLLLAMRCLKGAARETLGLVATVCLLVQTSPLMVGGSIQPQLDGSIGVLLVGVCCVCLYFSSEAHRRRSMVAWAALSGLVAAMGKNEWALAFMAACLAIGGLALVRKESLLPIGAMLAGVLLGSGISMAMDFADYWDGFALMFKFGAGTREGWLHTFQLRWPWIWPLVPLGLLALCIGGRAAKASRQALSSPNETSVPSAGGPQSVQFYVLGLWSLALCGGFLLTSWSGDFFPRYFCPGLFGLLCFITIGAGHLKFAKGWLPAVILLSVAAVCYNLFTLQETKRKDFAIGSYPGTSLPEIKAAYQDYYERRIEFRRRGEVPLTNCSYGYLFPDADFTSKPLEEVTTR